jgi:hypothetical protein
VLVRTLSFPVAHPRADCCIPQDIAICVAREETVAVPLPARTHGHLQTARISHREHAARCGTLAKKKPRHTDCSLNRQRSITLRSMTCHRMR